MEYRKALEQLRLKFTSGNSVPVERASITREEFEAITRRVVVTLNHLGEIVLVSRQDEEGEILEVIFEGLTNEEKLEHIKENAVIEQTIARSLEEARQTYGDLDRLSELGAYHRSLEPDV